jgi:hypothetical protein
MKNRLNVNHGKKSERLITTFGHARLVWREDGSTELRGGRVQDQTTAKEWISLFMHEAIVRIAR